MPAAEVSRDAQCPQCGEHHPVVPRPGSMTVILNAIRDVIDDYHYALDTRQHGGLASSSAVKAIECILDDEWIRGRVLEARRQGIAPDRSTKSPRTKREPLQIALSIWGAFLAVFLPTFFIVMAREIGSPPYILWIFLPAVSGILLFMAISIWRT